MKFVEHGALFDGRQKGMEESGLGEMEDFGCGEPHILGMAVFIADGRFKHGRIVTRERNRNAAPEKQGKWVRVVSGGSKADLAGQTAGAKIARWAKIERNVTRGYEVHGALVAHRGDAVVDAFHSQEFDRFADDFRSANFPGMD